MKTADVCLVLEGTYPFVSGGVSSWVHRLTSDMPQHTFRILHISPKRGFYPKGPVYEMPKNILGVQEVYLHDYVLSAKGRPSDLRTKVEKFRSLVHDMQDGKSGSFAHFLDALQAERGEGFSSFDLLQTWDSWDVLVESYRKEAGDESFLNFFWTWRYAYLPLFNLLSAPIPKARVYHTISTGYAGMLAAGAAIRYGRPMLLTEHGIYTKERRIEINRCDWIQDWDSGELIAERKPPFFRRYWIRQFEMMSRVTYEYADEIYTLYTGNTIDQIADGAEPKKIRVIPNGIDLDRFGEAAKAHDARAPNKRFTVCFLGRVCPIKDVITFINAMRLVADKVPDVHCRVMGPMDEDPEYADMCKRQVELLDLGDNVFFEGKVQVLEELPKVDVMILTSISEAQPLVILEAGAIGIPSIATDVGSCSELLYGRGPEDRALGAGGVITAMASPGETARAILELHDNPELRERMRDAMRARVEKFYDQRDMVSAYDEIYERYKTSDDRREVETPEPVAMPEPEPEPEVEETPEVEVPEVVYEPGYEPPSPEPEPVPEPEEPESIELPELMPVPTLPADDESRTVALDAPRESLDTFDIPDPGPVHPPDVDPVTETAQPGVDTQTARGLLPDESHTRLEFEEEPRGHLTPEPDPEPEEDPDATATRVDPDEETETRDGDPFRTIAREITKTELEE
ncbi:MAG: GT4 family glycosyltransferase PelF [Planctomycetota bacterium]